MSKPKEPPPSTRKSVALPDEMWEEIATFRHGERIGSEAETIRRLVRSGLQAEKKAVAKRARAREVGRATIYRAAEGSMEDKGDE